MIVTTYIELTEDEQRIWDCVTEGSVYYSGSLSYGVPLPHFEIFCDEHRLNYFTKLGTEKTYSALYKLMHRGLLLIGGEWLSYFPVKFVPSSMFAGVLFRNSDDCQRYEEWIKNTQSDPVITKTRRLPHDRGGFVYLLKSSTGSWKIGKTKYPDDRIYTFGVKLPFEVEYDHLIESDDMSSLEKSLHRQFKKKRINGEWFALDDNDVQYIKSLKGDVKQDESAGM